MIDSAAEHTQGSINQENRPSRDRLFPRKLTKILRNLFMTTKQKPMTSPAQYIPQKKLTRTQKAKE